MSRTGGQAAAWISHVVDGDGITADAGRIAMGRRNAESLAIAFKRGDGFRLGRIPPHGLHLRAVDAVLHAPHDITADRRAKELTAMHSRAYGSVHGRRRMSVPPG